MFIPQETSFSGVTFRYDEGSPTTTSNPAESWEKADAMTFSPPIDSAEEAVFLTDFDKSLDFPQITCKGHMTIVLIRTLIIHNGSF